MIIPMMIPMIIPMKSDIYDIIITKQLLYTFVLYFIYTIVN
jgi:hypothetical protein